MSIPKEVAKNFADIIKESTENNQNEIYIKGTVNSKDENDNITVILDGSDSAIPVTTAMDAEPEDRVMVMIKNHEATIVGNLTSPASARTADSYMKLTENGLVIGRLNNPSSRTEACEDWFDGDGSTYEFTLSKKANGTNSMAVFIDDVRKTLNTDYEYIQDENLIKFKLSPPASGSSIRVTYRRVIDLYLLLTGNSYIIMEGDAINPSQDSILATFSSFNYAEDDNQTLIGGNGNTLFANDANDAMYLSGLNAKEQMITLFAVGRGRVQSNINFTAGQRNPTYTYNDGSMNSDNVQVLLKHSNVFPIIRFGEIVASTVSIPADSYKTITSPQITPPSGYSLMCLRAITHNHTQVCHMTQWGVDLSNNKCWATFHNTSSQAQDMNVKFYYICYRSLWDY